MRRFERQSNFEKFIYVYQTRKQERVLNAPRGPKSSSIKQRKFVPIYMLHINKTLQGWRYLKNQPIHGQRLWTNAWTAYRCNVLLKPYILKTAERFYGNLPKTELYTAYLAEYTNRLWHKNWYRDWVVSKKERLKIKNKRLIKIDLYSMAKNQILTKRKFNKLTKKQKSQHNQYHFSVGFNLNFTKRLMANLYKLRSTAKNARSAKLIFTTGRHWCFGFGIHLERTGRRSVNRLHGQGEKFQRRADQKRRREIEKRSKYLDARTNRCFLHCFAFGFAKEKEHRRSGQGKDSEKARDENWRRTKEKVNTA